MDNEQGQRGRGRGGGTLVQVLHQGSNNNVYPPDWVSGSQGITSYSQLDETSREAFLHDKGYLFGVRIESNNGPRRSLQQAARRTSKVPLRIQESNNIDSEVVTTENARDTNYVNKGWLLSVISEKSPWTLSRIACSNQVNGSSRSITKCVLIQKLRVDLSPKDISPVPELEEAFKEALGQPTRSEKSQAIYRVFEHWGDVIPLVFDIGISLAVTDSESIAKNYLTDRTFLGLHLSMSASARPSTLGGDPTTLRSEDNVRAWLCKPVPIKQWEQVRIIKVTPLAAILNPELQLKLTELHQSLTTYCPSTPIAIVSNGISFDGAPHAFNTVSKVSIYSDGYYIKSLSVKYTNEPSPVKYGAEQNPNNEFELVAGEHITDITIWKDTKGVCGIQMSTSRGTTSKHFGSDGGSPTIMRSPGGCLSGFSGIVQGDMIHDLQTIWRHDVQGSELSGDREFSQYYGGVGGTPFSDWPYLTYEDSGSGGQGSILQQANHHGGSGGKEGFFRLEPNEHIVAVLGRYNKYIVQLCFVTNRGRASDIFGGGEGDSFKCQAPKTSNGRDTRLHYISGKSGDWLNGILLAWAPL
ncbi:unnamed protein product [Rhizoctonia solani]|uniref:Jacalin-type lectin domain-containing protein n=1 Tax=Rhizoctonia solani TaxID=456999 RepID=A0A8H3DQN0_9AGAM|nr:unnamed protein product [Rhizoctonia solani]